jgi:hypothetical protein
LFDELSECLGASKRSPRDVTFGSDNSLGPSSVFRGLRRTARARGTRTAVPSPSLPAQGLRAVLSADPTPESLLQCRVPAGCRALALPSGEPDVAGQSGGPALPSGAVAALSAADSAAHAVRTVRTARCRDGRSGPGPGIRRARGPAPRDNSCGLFRSSVPASGLLRVVRGRFGVVGTAVLFVRVPPGDAQRVGP